MLLGQPEDLLRIDIARDDQGCVVRGVPEAVPVAQILDACLLQIAGPADHRDAVGGGDVSDGVEAFEGQGLGVVVGAGTALLLDDLQFFGELLRLQGEIAHALGLELEGDLQTVVRERLEIGGVVTPGEGVLLPAVLRDDARELARGEPLGTLEHHVLEQVRHAGDPAVLVTRSHLVPDLRDEDRGASVRFDQHLEAVVECPFIDGLGRRQRKGRQTQEQAEKDSVHGDSGRMQFGRRNRAPARNVGAEPGPW